jgi:hypothetical protein
MRHIYKKINKLSKRKNNLTTIISQISMIKERENKKKKKL